MSSMSSYIGDFLSDSDALCFKLILDCISLNCFDSVDSRLRFEKLYFLNSLLISTHCTRIKKHLLNTCIKGSVEGIALDFS